MTPTLTQAASLPNIPWQNRPGNCSAPVWRYTENPIISRNPIPDVARIFNSAVIPYQGAYVGVFRGEQVNGIPFIYFGRSRDGIHWEFEPDKIQFVDENGAVSAGLRIRSPTGRSGRNLLCHLVSGRIWCSDRHGKDDRFPDICASGKSVPAV